MCYHLSLKFGKTAMSQRYKIREENNKDNSLPLAYLNAFSFPKMPAVFNSVTHSDKRVCEAMQWGLIPHWIKTNEEAVKIREMTLNARMETIGQKPAFKNAYANNRCLIPYSAYFEWREVQKQKYPYAILPESQIGSLAGIFNEWGDPETGELFFTVSIVTMEANPTIGQIHNTKKRMPIEIPQALEEDWLNAEKQNHSEILEYNLTRMPSYFTISRTFRQEVSLQNPDFPVAAEYPELAFYPIE